MLIAGVQLLAFVVQKEVADRLRAKEGSNDYGPLTVMAQMLSEVEYLRKLPPAAFWPAPGGDSALVRMVRQDRFGARVWDLSSLVQQGLSRRGTSLRKGPDRVPLTRDGGLATSWA